MPDNSVTEDEELEPVSISIMYQWTCPACDEVNETDIEPDTGDVLECDACSTGKAVVA